MNAPGTRKRAWGEKGEPQPGRKTRTQQPQIAFGRRLQASGVRQRKEISGPTQTLSKEQHTSSVSSQPDIGSSRRKAQPDTPTSSTGMRLPSNACWRGRIGNQNKESKGERTCWVQPGGGRLHSKHLEHVTFKSKQCIRSGTDSTSQVYWSSPVE